MKKFLTVLLALSVVFTYTVGTAFADVTTDPGYHDFATNVDDAENEVAGELNALYLEALNKLADTSRDNYAISKEAWKAGAKAYYDDKITAYGEWSKKLKADYATYGGKTIQELVATYPTKVADADALCAMLYTGTSGNGIKYSNVAARTQFNADRKEKLRIAGLIAIGDYDRETRDITLDDGTKVSTSYYALAEEAKAELVALFNSITIKDTATLAEAKAASEALEAARHHANGIGKYWDKNADADVEEWVFYADRVVVKGDTGYTTVTLKTAEQIENEDLIANATKEQVKSMLAAKSAALYTANVGFKADKTYDANRFAEAEASRNALVTSFEFLIEVAETDDCNITYADLATWINAYDEENANWDANFKENAIKDIEAIKDLEAYAAKYKAETDAEGNLLRDADAVNKVVLNAKIEAYGNLDELWTGMATAKLAIKYNCFAPDQALVFAKASKKAHLAEAKEAALDNYYAKEQPAVIAAYDAAIAKVDSAKTVADVTAINAVLYTIKDKNAVNGIITPAVEAEVAGPLKEYAEFVNSTKADKDKIDYTDINWVTFYAEKDARSAADVRALLDDAKAKIDSLQTVDQLATQKAAVEKMIKDINLPVALADKEAVKAAWEANNAYEANFATVTDAERVYNYDHLNAMITALVKLENAALKAEFDKLPALAKITLADKAAVKELAAKVNALKDLAAANSNDMYEGNADWVTVDMSNYTEKIQKLDAKAVMNAIDALPLNITAADKAAVKAAREAYDAYVAEYTILTPYLGHNAALDIRNRAALFIAEDAVKELNIEEKEALKEAVKGTHMAIGSSAAKGYIRISWKQKVTDVALDGVEVYRSTKQTTGFKKISTFKKQTAKKYTANLKKGTKYYYYVKGYKMVDGVKYYTHKSITVGRTFR